MKNLVNVLKARINDRKANTTTWALENSNDIINSVSDKFAEIVDVSLDNIKSIKAVPDNDRPEVVSSRFYTDSMIDVRIELYIGHILRSKKNLSKIRFTKHILINLVAELLAYKNKISDSKEDINKVRSRARGIVKQNKDIVNEIYLQYL